jgi:hypothetical protein
MLCHWASISQCFEKPQLLHLHGLAVQEDTCNIILYNVSKFLPRHKVSHSRRLQSSTILLWVPQI